MRVRRDYGGLAAFDSRTTIVNDVTLADQLLRDATGTFEVSQNFLGQNLNRDELASILGARQLLTPDLRPAALQAVPQHVHELVRLTLDDSSRAPTLTPVDAEKIVARAFSWQVFGAGQEPFLPQVAQLLDSLEDVIGNVFAAPASWRTPKQRRIEQQHAKLKADLLDYLQSRDPTNAPLRLSRHHGTYHHSGGLADHLLRRGGSYPIGLLADLLIGAMLAAQRVPAAGAGWLLMMLADHPQLQVSLSKEAELFTEKIQSGEEVSATDFPSTLAAVLEALRLYPPTWLITRVATQDARLGPYTFRAGHMFMISPYVLHRDPDLYERPEVYSPDRWLDSPPPPATFLSFGRGRHRCPGADMTTTSLVAMTLSILESHDVRRSGSVHPDPRNTLKPRGLIIELRPRSVGN